MSETNETDAQESVARKVSQCLDEKSPASSSAPEDHMYPWTWEYTAWFVILIAASETFVCLDLPQLDGKTLHSSLVHVDLSGTFLNVSGSFLEGFFASWDEKEWVKPAREPSLSTIRLLRSVSGVIRDSILAAYMSWVALVEHGGELSRMHGSIWVGAAYCVVTVALGLAAHAVGVVLARALVQLHDGSNTGPDARPRLENDGTLARITILVGIAAYVATAFVRCVRTKDDANNIVHYPDGFEIEEGYALIPSMERSAALRLAVSMAFAIVGAHAGNCVGENIKANVLFAGLNLSCHVVLLNMAQNVNYWSRSHLLSAFMGSFCGSGSSFGGMCSGIMDGLWINRTDARKHNAALWSLFLHLAFAVVFVCAYSSFGYYN